MSTSFNTEQRDHLVEVTSLTYTDGEIVRNEPVHISPEAAIGFANKLIQTATAALTHAIRDMAAGHCATCNNLRMIHPLKHGRPTAQHCPDCWPMWSNAMRNLPTISSLVELEAKELR